jgi:hypothetical protein
LDEDQVIEIVKRVMRDGDFVLPGGLEPSQVLEDHSVIFANQAAIKSGMEVAAAERGFLLDAVCGPVVETYPGHLERDEDKGLMFLVSEHKNGGLNTRIPWGRLILVLAGQVAAIITALALFLQ